MAALLRTSVLLFLVLAASVHGGDEKGGANSNIGFNATDAKEQHAAEKKGATSGTKGKPAVDQCKSQTARCVLMRTNASSRWAGEQLQVHLYHIQPPRSTALARARAHRSSASRPQPIC
eukprot:4613119-Pleurochrysis_carterae.AAC.3